MDRDVHGAKTAILDPEAFVPHGRLVNTFGAHLCALEALWLRAVRDVAGWMVCQYIKRQPYRPATNASP